MVQFTKYIVAAATVAAFGTNVEAQDEIVGGSPVTAGAYPWMVSLGSNGRHFCGGSLIAPDIVLTAAHCISSRTITVRILGGGLLSSGSEDIPVTESVRHPSYNSGTYDSDIAILKLGRSSSITPVDFDLSTLTWAGVTSRVIGWGTTSAGGSSPSNLLQVDVPVRTNAECDETSYPGLITDQMICAGIPSGGIDSCQGDSGGPQFVVVDGKPVVVGVVSWGYGCASAGRYGVYARVASMLPFIGEFVDVNPDGPGEGTSPPTTSPTPSPPVEEVVCQCNGGEGRFEQCDAWGYNFNVCLLAYGGDRNNPPPCKVANGGEFLYSNNYSNWYMKGCTRGRRVFPLVDPNPATLDGSDEIVGGSPVAAGDYPWMVSLGNNGRHTCGGSLIAPDVVLTAAHCLGRTYTARIKGGILTSNGVENIPVTAAIRHPQYNSGNSDYDIAIMLLSRSSSIAPVAFDLSSNTWAGMSSRVIGWGATSSGGGSPRNILQVDVPVRTNAECDSTAYPGLITDQMICAGIPAGGIDSCQGDSGGPQFINVGGQPVVVGVVSWGYGCASRNRYGVYARVSSMLPFIGQYVDLNPGVPSPTPSPTPAPPVGDVVCQCDGGSGRFETCDAWGYNFNVCLLAYSGDSNNPPPCKVANGGEFAYSSNYSNWYMKGCTRQRQVFAVDPSTVELVSAVTDDDDEKVEAKVEAASEGTSPVVAGVVGALAGCFVVLATTFAVLRANKGGRSMVVQDQFSQRSSEPKGNMMVTTEL